MANPDLAADLFYTAERVDLLLGYTPEMWDIFTDVVLLEWFGMRLPPPRLPWDGPIYLPDQYRFIHCLDRHAAHRTKAEIEAHYLALNRGGSSLSVFAGYALEVPDDLARERDGMEFLARQHEHLRSPDEYLFIVQQRAA